MQYFLLKERIKVSYRRDEKAFAMITDLKTAFDPGEKEAQLRIKKKERRKPYCKQVIA